MYNRFLTSQNMGSFLAKSTTRVIAGVIIFVNWLKASMSTLLPSGALTMGAEPMSSGWNERKGRGSVLSNTGTYRKWTFTETKVWHSKSSFPSKAQRRPELQQDISPKQEWSPVIKREKRKDEKLKLSEQRSVFDSSFCWGAHWLGLSTDVWIFFIIKFLRFVTFWPENCDVKDRAKNARLRVKKD